MLSLLVLVLVLAVVCAIGLMFSTLTARPVASAVLTYLTMGALVFGTTIGFGLSAFLVIEEEQQQVYGIPETGGTQQPPVEVDPRDRASRRSSSEELKFQRQPDPLRTARRSPGVERRAHRADLVDAAAQPVRRRGRRRPLGAARGGLAVRRRLHADALTAV